MHTVISHTNLEDPHGLIMRRRNHYKSYYYESINYLSLDNLCKVTWDNFVNGVTPKYAGDLVVLWHTGC